MPACCIHKQLTEIAFSLFLQSVCACNRYAFMVIRPCKQCAMTVSDLAKLCSYSIAIGTEYMYRAGARGGVVFKPLFYNPEGREFETR
jgi:hypothetical protein